MILGNYCCFSSVRQEQSGLCDIHPRFLSEEMHIEIVYCFFETLKPIYPIKLS